MILDETFEIIKPRLELENLKIADILLGNPDNMIQLNNSWVGTALNYFKFESEKKKDRNKKFLMGKLDSDPLLLKCLFKGSSRNLLKLSLKTCLVGALSTSLMADSPLFNISNKRDDSIFSGVNSATVIGFGGFMDFIIQKTKIRKIHISDLYYNKENKSFYERIVHYRKEFPGKIITISDGSDNKKMIQASELVSITGSALCNGTMETLLDYAKNCKKAIIQGGSAAIYPEPFFRRGVSLISTRIKPPYLMECARTDPERFKYLLEGKLPRIYITKK